MSLSHELRVLELETQIELLERLQLLTNFGSNLVTVGGKAGSGKSWLAQRYLEAWVTEKNQCLLLCHPSQNDLQRRALILNQILPDSLFNQQDTLSDSLERLLDGESCDVVIVIDDAHQLTELLISELWMLVLEAQTNPLWTVNVVLFSESGNLDSLLTRLSYGQEHKPIDLEVDELTEIEALQFFESLVIRYVDDDAEKRVRSAFKKALPLPGDLMALGELKVEKRIIIRSIIASPATIVLLIALLLVIIGGGYWWMLSQPSPEDKAQALIAPVEQTAIPTLEASDNSELIDGFVDNSAAANEAGEQPELDPSYQGAIDDSSSLPPTVTEDAASVGTLDSGQQRVVINSDIVDALLEGTPESVDTSAIDSVTGNLTMSNLAAGNDEVVNNTAEQNTMALTEMVKDAPLVNPALNEVVVNQEPSVAEDQAADLNQAAPSKTITFFFARDELKALSPRGYTLQLGAVTSLEDVQVFIEKYQVQNKARVYPTVRNGSEWFIITYEDYPTIQVARDAVESLPENLKNLDPWAKSMNQVHREIDRVE